MGRRETDSGQPAQVRLLPATTLTFTKSVNQKPAAFCDTFNCPDEMETAEGTERELTFS